MQFQTVCRFAGVWEVLYGREIINNSAGFFRLDGMNGRKLYNAEGVGFDSREAAEQYLQARVLRQQST
jgi:hypothetical protein